MRYKYTEPKALPGIEVHAVKTWQRHKLKSVSGAAREIGMGNEEQILAISEGGEPRLLCCFCGWLQNQARLINRIKRWWQTNKWGEGLPDSTSDKNQRPAHFTECAGPTKYHISKTSPGQHTYCVEKLPTPEPGYFSF